MTKRTEPMELGPRGLKAPLTDDDVTHSKCLHWPAVYLTRMSQTAKKRKEGGRAARSIVAQAALNGALIVPFDERLRRYHRKRSQNLGLRGNTFGLGVVRPQDAWKNSSHNATTW